MACLTARGCWEQGVSAGLGFAHLRDHPGVSGSHQGHSMMGLGIPLCTKKNYESGDEFKEELQK